MEQTTKLEKLQTKRAEIDARIEKLVSQSNAQRRKARTRALVLIGAAMEAELKAAPDALNTIRQIVSDRLTTSRDRTDVLIYLDQLHKEIPNA